MPTPTFSLDFAKVGIGILVIDFPGNIFMSSGGFQNLLNKFLFNLTRHSTLYDLPFQNYDQSKTSRKVTVWKSYVSIMNTNGILQKVLITSMTDWWRRTFHVRIQSQVKMYFFRLLHISILFLWKKNHWTESSWEIRECSCGCWVTVIRWNLPITFIALMSLGRVSVGILSSFHNRK